MSLYFVLWSFIVFISFLLGLLIFIHSLKRYIRINRYSVTRSKIQKTELIDNKYIVASDGYRLKIYLNKFNNQDKNIYLFIHDIFGINNSFYTFLKKTNKNVIIFLQRGYQENDYAKKSISNTIVDIGEIISLLKSEYENSDIILVSEGFSSFISKKCQKKVKKTIIINPIINYKLISLPYRKKLYLSLPLIANLKGEINLSIKYDELTNDKSVLGHMKKVNSIKLNYLFFHHLIKISKKVKFNQSDNVKIIQANKSFFYDIKYFNKKFKSLNEIELIDSTNHIVNYLDIFN